MSHAGYVLAAYFSLPFVLAPHPDSFSLSACKLRKPGLLSSPVFSNPLTANGGILQLDLSRSRSQSGSGADLPTGGEEVLPRCLELPPLLESHEEVGPHPV